MKVFVVSNSYIESLFANMAEYILNQSVDSIILLKENHNSDEAYFTKANIEYSENITRAIEKSDVTVLITYEGMVPLLKEKINLLCANNKKRLYIFDYSKQDDSQDFVLQDIPAIILLSLGYFNQHCFTEMLVYKVLTDLNYRVHQTFSCQMKEILKEINKIRSDLSAQNNCKNDIQVVSMSYRKIEQFFNDFKALERIRNSHIRLLIVSIEDSFSYFEILSDFLFFNLQIDAVVYMASSYCAIKKNNKGEIRFVYMERTKEQSNVFKLNNPETELKIKRKINSILSFPQVEIIY